MAVLRAAKRARAALIVCASAGVALTAAFAVAAPARALAAAPLLVLPSALALRWSPRPLGGLLHVLRADPWGPSDPPIRARTAEPRLTVPAQLALVGSPAALAVSADRPVATVVVYALTGAAAGCLTRYARYRCGVLERVRAGALRRTVAPAREDERALAA
ncbi:hypothetical protein GCM10023196_076700 [Actinoallomurus vinaceus]|uniref:Integral membrane protein n=2 Tax=Actinoallomurus vinaceus TaxID=1080074 RepID=A0ABP8UM34_9ACTN